jgi:hypothetical protein
MTNNAVAEVLVTSGLLHTIIQYFDFTTISRFMRVCRAFRDFASDDRLYSFPRGFASSNPEHATFVKNMGGKRRCAMLRHGALIQRNIGRGVRNPLADMVASLDMTIELIPYQERLNRNNCLFVASGPMRYGGTTTLDGEISIILAPSIPAIVAKEVSVTVQAMNQFLKEQNLRPEVIIYHRTLCKGCTPLPFTPHLRVKDAGADGVQLLTNRITMAFKKHKAAITMVFPLVATNNGFGFKNAYLCIPRDHDDDFKRILWSLMGIDE